MRYTGFSRACASALLATLLLTTVSALAIAKEGQGRNFAGFYSVGHPKMHGELVHFTLHLQVYNNGRNDVRDAVITLRQNTGLDLVGSAKPIAILRGHDHVNLSQQFTVSRREYEKWHNGSQPGLSITYRANGKTWDRSIQVSPKDF
jgi:hypothetical protein